MDCEELSVWTLASSPPADVQQENEDDPEPPHIKEEEEEVWLGEDGEEEAAVRRRKTQTRVMRQRVSATAQQILFLFERTITEYEGRVSCLREENERQAKLLDTILKPQVHLHRAGEFTLSLWRPLHQNLQSTCYQ